MLKIVLIIALFNVLLINAKIDRTLEEKASGNDVVDAVIQKIRDSGIFYDDNNIMKRIAYVESKFGNDPNTFRDGYYGGIWNVDQIVFNTITKQSKIYPLLNADFLPAIKEKFGIDIENLDYKELLKPLYSGLLARLNLAVIEEPIPDGADIKKQAVYWEHYYFKDDEDLVDVFVKDVQEMENVYSSSCRGLMDLVIVMDGSGSINLDGNDNYKLAKEFVVNIIETFSIASVNVGFVVFSYNPEVIFSLNSNLTGAQMQAIIKNSNYPGGGTNTNLGIESGVKMLNEAEQRPGVPKILALFTDGQPTCADHELQRALNIAKKYKITILAVGIGYDIDQDKLLEIAGSSKHVFLKSSYNSLSHSFKQINGETCKIPQKPELGSKYKDVLVKRERRYYTYVLPYDGITLNINNHGGKTIGYYSYENENPSSAINDGQFSGQAFIPWKKAGNNRVKRNAIMDDMNSTVFIAIEGIESTNNYTLESELGDHLSVEIASHFIAIITSIIIILIIIIIIIIWKRFAAKGFKIEQAINFPFINLVRNSSSNRSEGQNRFIISFLRGRS